MSGWQLILPLVLATFCLNPLRIQAQNSAPVFSSANYTAMLSETAPNGTVVDVTITATDADGVSYSILTGGDAFNINASTGEVSVMNSQLIDYEESPLMTVVIEATDFNTNPASSTVELFISLINENDNPPVFQSVSYSFSAVEEESGLTVGTIQATDADGDSLTYQFTDTSLSEFTLTTESNIATLSVTSKLDFEDQPMFNFTVAVTDGSFIVLTTVVVSVIDIIDQRPVIKPVSSQLLIDLDEDQRSVDLSHLEVTDDDNLYSGTASVKYLFDGDESVSMHACIQYIIINTHIPCMYIYLIL